MFNELPEKVLLGQVVELEWDTSIFGISWLICYRKESLWFWKNYHFIKNSGHIAITVSDKNFEYKLYRLAVFGLKRIFFYKPAVNDLIIKMGKSSLVLGAITPSVPSFKTSKLKHTVNIRNVSSMVNLPTSRILLNKLK
jgi:hypothetical protein